MAIHYVVKQSSVDQGIILLDPFRNYQSICIDAHDHDYWPTKLGIEYRNGVLYEDGVPVWSAQ